MLTAESSAAHSSGPTEEMLRLAEKSLGRRKLRACCRSGPASAWPEQAERWLRDGLRPAGLDQRQLERSPGSDPRKIALAQLLWRRTTVSQGLVGSAPGDARRGQCRSAIEACARRRHKTRSCQSRYARFSRTKPKRNNFCQDYTPTAIFADPQALKYGKSALRLRKKLRAHEAQNLIPRAEFILAIAASF